MRLRVKTLTGAVHTVEVNEADDITAVRISLRLIDPLFLAAIKEIRALSLLWAFQSQLTLYQLQDRVAAATGFGADGLRLLHAGELLRAGPIRHVR